MRKTVFASSLFALIAAAAPLTAQDPGMGMGSMSGKWIFGIGGGTTIPIGDASDIFKSGYNVSGMVGYKPSGSSIAFLLDVGYHRADNKFLVGLDSTDTASEIGHSNIITAFGRVNFDLSSNIYLLAGVGVYRREFPVEGSNIIFTNTDASVAGTGGIGFVLAKHFFVEGRVIHKFSDPSSTIIPITAGIRF